MKKIFSLLIIALLAIFRISGQSISFTYDADGNMTLRYVITLRSAVAEEDETEVSEISSTELSEQKITIYPNPTQGQIAIEVTPFDVQKKCFLRLFDLSGKVINTQKIETKRTELEIVGAAGIYLLDIHLGENISKWKIIKQ